MGGIAGDRMRQVEIDFVRAEWRGRQEADGYLRPQEQRLLGNGGQGVEDEVEQRKGGERKRVVLECERETVEGMVVETPGEQRSVRQGSRWGPVMALRG